MLTCARGVTSLTAAPLSLSARTNAAVVPMRHYSAGGGAGRARKARMAVAEASSAEERFIVKNVGNNVTPYIANLIGSNLHQKSDHPWHHQGED